MRVLLWIVGATALVANLFTAAWALQNYRRYEDTTQRRDERFRQRIVKNERARIRAMRAIR